MKDLVITSLETITAFDITTGAYLFTLDELQNATVAQTEETTDITGKGGRRLSTLKRNKAVTISGTNGMVSGGLLEQQTGGTFATKVTRVAWTDHLAVVSNAATTTYKAVGETGEEITGLFVRGNDGSLGTELTQSDTATANTFTYDPATRALGFSGIADNTEIVVFYQRNITADVLENRNDIYAKKCSLYVDALGEDKCANVYRIQFFFPKADFNGEFTFEMGDNQTVHAFEAEALGGACGVGGQMWTFTVFGADEPDHPALASIAITTPPTKTTYEAGEGFNGTGMVVTATYVDNSTAVVTDYTVSPLINLQTTDTKVTVSYTDNGITKTAEQAITVTD